MSIIKVETLKNEEYASYGLSKEKLKDMLRKILLIRYFEEKVEELFLVKGLLIGPAHLCFGGEASAVGIISALDEEDIILSNHRGHGHALAKGISPKNIMAELFGKITGTCKGLSGSMHVCIDINKGALYSSAIVASNIPIAVGVGYALKRMNDNRIVACFFGDGGTNTGAFHEGLNMASILKVPVIFVCENNQYGMSVPISQVLAAKNIAERVYYGYGIKTYVADGMDVLATYKAAKLSIEYTRKEKKPSFIETIIYRLKGHGVYDKAEYRPKGEAEKWWERDPVKLFSKRLINENIISEKEIKEMNENIKKEVEEAIVFSLRSDVFPFDELYKLVYSGGYK
ncbi:MAG: thiamine pyrophosphate-dependent dehydrogenase E1 component subunit alpha [Nitrososphaerota archaeon]